MEPETVTDSPKVKSDGETEQERMVGILDTVKITSELDAPSWVASPSQLAETLQDPNISEMNASL